jgi:hypothetical protein
MTRRERLEAKADRRDLWSAAREAKARRSFDAVHRLADQIPMGQPILVGHHSEKRARRDADRIHSGMMGGIESQAMAAHHASKADGLRRQLDVSIFADDDRAIEALQARINAREAEANRITAYNKTCRAAAKAGEQFGDLSLLSDSQKARLVNLARICPSQMRPGGAFPSYVTTNLRGNISSDRKRIEEIERRVRLVAEAEESPLGYVVNGDDIWVSITFVERPDRAIIDRLKAAGFYWRGGSWSGYRKNIPDLRD